MVIQYVLYETGQDYLPVCPLCTIVELQTLVKTLESMAALRSRRIESKSGQGTTYLSEVGS